MGDYKTFGSTDSLFRDSVFQETVRIKLTQALRKPSTNIAFSVKILTFRTSKTYCWSFERGEVGRQRAIPGH